jgi:transcriptional regulator GlxA family with amidase domain
MHTVALVVFDRISPFEMAVPCEVFGADRSDMGLPNYRFLVCAAQEGMLRTDAGFAIVAPWRLDGLREAQTVVVPAWRDVNEAPLRHWWKPCDGVTGRERGSFPFVRGRSSWPRRACSTVGA